MYRNVLIGWVAVLLLGLGGALAATLEVSQPVQVTSDAYYERGQAVAFDGTDYWLIYARSTTVTGNYGTGNPDTHDYNLYYKRAATIAGLPAAAPVQITSSADSYLGETDAAYVGGKVWAFATLDVGTSATLYGWYTTDGSSWTQVVLKTGLPDGAAHHAAAAFGGELWVAYNAGTDWWTLHSATPESVDWSTLTPASVGDPGTDGTGKFYSEGGNLYLALAQSSRISIMSSSGGPWSLVDQLAVSSTYDASLFKVGSTYVFAASPWNAGAGVQTIDAWVGGSLATLLSGGQHVVIDQSAYGTNVWISMWPTGTTAGGAGYVFYTSERDEPAAEGTGNVWYLEVDWDVTRNHFTYIQPAVDAGGAGDIISVAAGTYAERITINKRLDLRGAQYGVDPTPAGARTDPAAESTIDIRGIGVTNPNVAVEIPSGVNDVSFAGFTVYGSPTLHYADEGVVRAWGSRLAITDNVLDGYFGVIHKGANATSIDIVRNRVTINKTGLVIQPTPASDVGFIGNVFRPGSTPDADVAGMYMTGCSQVEVAGNDVAGFGNGDALRGSNNSHVAVSGNTFVGNRKGVSLWGNTTFVTVSGNTITGSALMGINIKGQDIDISENVITGNPIGVEIDFNAIPTQRVTIRDNNLSGNTTRALTVTATVTETVNASGNWWGSADPATVRTQANGGLRADYTPWLAAGTDTSTDPGFQGDFATLWVDDDSPQTGSDGRITEGAATVTGSTVYVAPGTYAETITFPAAFATDDVTIEGTGATRPVVDGGVKFANTGAFSGLTLRNLYLQGTARLAPNERIFWHANSGAINNFTLDNCVLDGQNVLDRQGIAGNLHGGALTMTDCEFKNILGFAVMDIDASSDYVPWGGNGLPFTTVTFADNYVHNCNGTVSLRGHTPTRTPQVDVHGNTFDEIGDNQGQQGEQWAAIEINHADLLSFYHNEITEVALGVYGEGQAVQMWDIGAIDIYENVFTGCYQGIYVFGGTLGGSYGGPWPVPTGALTHNTIAGNSQYGVSVDPGASGGPLDALENWWGDASGPYHPTLNPTGTGNAASDNVLFDPWIGKSGTGNIVFFPDPQYFATVGSSHTLVARYLGGASGPIHSWEILIDRDGTVVGTNSIQVEAPASGPFADPDALIQAVNHPTQNKVIVSGTLTTDPAYWGDCDLFRVTYSAVAEGVKWITPEVSYFRSCPFAGCNLQGAVGDAGEFRVDVTSPAVSVVEFVNDSLPHTNDWAKYGDGAHLNARVVEADPYLEVADFTADLSGLGQGALVNPTTATYDDVNGWYDLAWAAFAVLRDVAETSLKTITVTATDNSGHVGTGNDTVTLDNQPPSAPTALTAAPGHEQTTLGWAHGTDGGGGVYYQTTVIYTTPYGTYPEYGRPDWPPATMGPDPNLGANEGAAYPWNTGTSTVHAVAARDIYRYAAFGRDMALNCSVASNLADATNYRLGDVAPPGTYDGAVGTSDISALGSNYYHHLIDDNFNHECDVAQEIAPQNPAGIPAPDAQVDFEDLMIFALNFEPSNPLTPPPAEMPEGWRPGDVALYLEVPGGSGIGGVVVATAMLKDEPGIVQGAHFRVAYDPGVLEYVGTEPGSLVSGCEANFFMALAIEGQPDVSAAALGAGTTFGHSGELARMSFRRTAPGAMRLELREASARSIRNEELLPQMPSDVTADDAAPAVIPTRVYLQANQPNPFSQTTALRFGLPETGAVRLAVFDVSGRSVRTLVNGVLPAAEHVFSWDRRDDSGHAVAAGVYLYRLETERQTITRKLVVSE